MQLRKISKLLLPASVAVAVAAVSMSSYAATNNFAVGFTTVPDITIIQVQPMDFGGGLGLAANAKCVMAASGLAGDYLGDTLMRLASAATGAAVGTPGRLTGVGCEFSQGLDGTLGLYEIQGIAGGAVSVKVNSSLLGTSFTYVPTGCIGNYNAVPDGDLCAAVVPNTNVPVKLAAAGDVGSNTGDDGSPIIGRTRIQLGGTITAINANPPGTLLTESFTIDVTY